MEEGATHAGAVAATGVGLACQFPAGPAIAEPAAVIKVAKVFEVARPVGPVLTTVGEP